VLVGFDDGDFVEISTPRRLASGHRSPATCPCRARVRPSQPSVCPMADSRGAVTPPHDDRRGPKACQPRTLQTAIPDLFFGHRRPEKEATSGCPGGFGALRCDHETRDRRPTPPSQRVIAFLTNGHRVPGGTGSRSSREGIPILTRGRSMPRASCALP
jgi:hypothetical protein